MEESILDIQGSHPSWKTESFAEGLVACQRKRGGADVVVQANQVYYQPMGTVALRDVEYSREETMLEGNLVYGSLGKHLLDQSRDDFVLR